MPRPKALAQDELLPIVIEELHRLAQDGQAPSTRQWNAHRRPDLPSDHKMRRRLDMAYSDVVAAAGLQMAAPQAMAPRGIADELERHVAAGAELADWNSRYHAALHVIPTPTRRETVLGRTISGEPCVIYREYFLVR